VAPPRTTAVLVCALMALIAAPAVARAAEPDAVPGDRIVLSGDVLVPRGTQSGEIVVLNGDVIVEGVARGDVVVLSGDVDIAGHVSGDVIAIDGQVTIGPGAQIRGDVLARGHIAIKPGASIDGAIRERTAFTWHSPADLFGRLGAWLAVSVSTLLLGLGLVLLAPRGLDAVASVSRTEPLIATGWSLAVVVAVPVTVILSVASLVALPLGLVMLLGVALLLFVGYACAAYAIGRALWREPRNRAATFAVGWLILRTIAAIPFLGGVTFGLAGAFGLGGALVATWRARETGGRHRERRVTIRLDDVAREEAGL
jgi:cytoskeletal protein CcmA (bactofilin family)